MESTNLPQEQESLLDDIASQSELADKSIRFANYIIDIIAYYVFSYIVGILLALVGMAFVVTEKFFLYLVAYIVYFLYYFLFEISTGKTLGKLITKTHVESTHGGKPTSKQILLRTLSRLVPFEPFSFLGNAGWHDKWSETMVVKNK